VKPVSYPLCRFGCQLLVLIVTLGASTVALAQDKAPVGVVIEGIDGPLLTNVKAYLDILKPAAQRPLSTTEVRRLYSQARLQIRQALQPFGYYSPTIKSDLQRSSGQWHARFHVDPGPPTHLRNVLIRVAGPGREDNAIKAALSEIHLAPGQQLDQTAYERAKSSLSEAAYGAGYLQAKYRTHKLRVTPAKAIADIDLELETGPRFYFGKVDIHQSILSPDFIARFVPFQPGEPFDTDKLLALQQALRDSNYFSTIEVHADKDKAGKNHRVPITVDTKPTKPQKYTFSAGFGTDTGPRVGAGIEFRHLNRHGHQFRINGQASRVKNTLAAQYKVPVENVGSDFVDLTGNVIQEHYGDVYSHSYAEGASLNDGWLSGRRHLYFKHRREIYHFGDQPSRRSELLIPGIAWSRKVADNPQNTTRGYSLELDVHGASDAAISDTSFLQGSINLRTVYPLATRTRLLLHATYAATKSANFDNLPPSERFFTGGARTVRGYAYQSLGPKDSAGNVVGGRYMEVGSVEVDRLLWGNFGMAAFFDAGNVADRMFFGLKRGVGLGVRYRTPVGMIRLDFAHPLDNPRGGLTIHVSIGPDL